MCAKRMRPSTSVIDVEIESAVLGGNGTERRSTKRVHFRAQSMYMWSVMCVEIGWSRVVDGQAVVEVDWDGREIEREKEQAREMRVRGGGIGSQTKKRNEIFRCFFILFLSLMPYLPFSLALDVPSLSLCWAGSHMASKQDD